MPKLCKNPVKQTCLIMFQILGPGVRIWPERPQLCQNLVQQTDNVSDVGAGFADLAGKKRPQTGPKSGQKNVLNNVSDLGAGFADVA